MISRVISSSRIIWFSSKLKENQPLNLNTTPVVLHRKYIPVRTRISSPHFSYIFKRVFRRGSAFSYTFLIVMKIYEN